MLVEPAILGGSKVAWKHLCAFNKLIWPRSRSVALLIFVRAEYCLSVGSSAARYRLVSTSFLPKACALFGFVRTLSPSHMEQRPWCMQENDYF